MAVPDRRLTRRRALHGLAGAGTLGSAGCLSLGRDSGGGQEPHLGICEISVTCRGEDDVEYPVGIDVTRADEHVYAEVHDLSGGRFVYLSAEEYEWLGDNVPYRVTVDPFVVDDSAVYDTTTASEFANCHGYHVTFDETGVAGGPLYQERVDSR